MTIVAWVVADLYHSANQKTVESIIADPVLLQYKIDARIIKLIESKQ